MPVVVGFNEFCAPSLEEALDQAVRFEAERVVILTPMLTRRGEHSELHIPAAVAGAKARHPSVEFAYAWPYAAGEVAAFLAAHIRPLIGGAGLA